MDDNPYRGPMSQDASIAGGLKQRRTFTIGKVLAALGIIVLLICMMLPAVRTSGGSARRSHCNNNLKQIALALQNYAEFYGALPPAYTTDADGKPLHSWRTLILPYMEEQWLYDSTDLTKPWDDPANAAALKTRLLAYQCPAEMNLDNRTTYLAVVTPNSCFRANQPRKLSEITDKQSRTIIVIEVGSEHAVPWMSPADADEEVILGIGRNSVLAHPGGVQAAFVDGSVHFLRADMPAAQRRALISMSGNEEVDVDVE